MGAEITGAYDSNRCFSFRNALTRRDARIDDFFEKAGIDTGKLTGDQKLYKNEIQNDKNTDNPRTKMLLSLFDQYATGVGKDADGNDVTCMTPNDLDKFIAATNYGIKDPQPVTAQRTGGFFETLGRGYIR